MHISDKYSVGCNCVFVWSLNRPRVSEHYGAAERRDIHGQLQPTAVDAAMNGESDYDIAVSSFTRTTYNGKHNCVERLVCPKTRRTNDQVQVWTSSLLTRIQPAAPGAINAL